MIDIHRKLGRDTAVFQVPADDEGSGPIAVIVMLQTTWICTSGVEADWQSKEHDGGQAVATQR